MASRLSTRRNRLAPTDARANPRVQVWASLAHVYHHLACRLDRALGDDGLTLAQFEVLARLHFDGGLSQSRLAERLLVTKGNVSGLLTRMARAGLVRRTRAPGDRRVHVLNLTRRGRAAFARALPKHVRLIEDAMTELAADELACLRQALAKLPGGDPARREGACRAAESSPD
jgi:DNA-binding MarR family transcriptional regulator